MAATGKASDSGLVSDALAAVNTSLGNKLPAPATPTSAQYVVFNPDRTVSLAGSVSGGTVTAPATATTDYTALLS